MAHYEQALRQVRYRNWRPATLSERKFRLTCSELNGRYTSNEFNLEVGVMFHPAPFLILSLLLSSSCPALFIQSLPSLHVLLFFVFLLIFPFLSLSFTPCRLLIVHQLFPDVTVFVPPLQVSVLHHSAPVEHVNHMAAQPQYMRPVHHPLMIHTLNSHMSGKPANIYKTKSKIILYFKEQGCVSL